MQELDGIQKSEGYILIGITNAPKCLDRALLSRFVTKVRFTKPQNEKEVAELFKVHLKNLVKIGAIEPNQKFYDGIGKEGFKLGFTGRMVYQFVGGLERERNELLTNMFKDNQQLINKYLEDPAGLKTKLNKESKRFTI